MDSAADTPDLSTLDGVCADPLGACTLRAALTQSNSSPGTDTIAFGIGAGPVTIALHTDLPLAMDPVIIDGTTQPGFRGTPIVELTPESGGSSSHGLQIAGGQSTVRGLVVNRFTYAGITLLVRDGDTVTGNYIGTDRTGKMALGNGAEGILAESGTHHVIGGTTAGSANVIAANGKGIVLEGGNDLVEGNLIGTDASGTEDLGNGGPGIQIFGSSMSVGGTTGAVANVISGNGGAGVQLFGTAASSNTISGNFIGTSFSGFSAIRNDGSGVEIAGGSSNVISNNTIGFNTGDGVFVSSGTGNDTLGNILRQNGGLGIDLAPDGVNANDTGDGDTGANDLQNAPVLTTPVFNRGNVDTLTVKGSLNSRPSTTYVLAVYVSRTCDPSGHGEASEQVGPSAFIATAANGNVVISKSLIFSTRPGWVIAATATDPSGNTSELSNCVSIPFTHTFTVNSTGDGGDTHAGDNVCDDGSGHCTFRAALAEANAKQDANDALITFSLGSGTHTLLPRTAYPTVAGATTIQNNPATGGTIVLDGSGTSSGTAGLRISAGNVVVANLSIIRFPGDGMDLTGSAPDAVVEACKVGTTGTTAGLGNGGDGINLAGFRQRVGSPAFGNVISGNGGNGVSIVAPSAGNGAAILVDNKIGTTYNALSSLPNGKAGVFVSASSNAVGKPGSALGNFISGNTGSGVEIAAGGFNTIQGNHIGTNLFGTGRKGNGRSGILVGGSSPNATTIGGTALGSGNQISANAGSGVEVASDAAGTTISGNLIGTTPDGGGGLGNDGAGVAVTGAQDTTIGGAVLRAGNLISANGGSGIELTGDSPGTQIAGNLIGADGLGTGDLGNGGDGISVAGSPGTVVGGAAPFAGNVASGNAESGIHVSGSSQDTAIQGNLVGTNAFGTAALPNDGSGVFLFGGTAETVGGADPGSGNLISGNALDGVVAKSVGGTKVLGNRIGTDLTGRAAVANRSVGVLFDGATGSVVGAAEAGSGNLISGNAQYGVLLTGGGTNRVEGNRIGTDAEGSAVIPNGYSGVRAALERTSVISANTIGGNPRGGISLDQSMDIAVAGNAIGTDPDGSVDLGNGVAGVDVGGGSQAVIGKNTIRFNGGPGIELFQLMGEDTGANISSNRIGDNDGLGIDLQGDGVTANDPGDADTGPNGLQNYPLISRIVRAGSGLRVTGSIRTSPNTSFIVELFSVPSCDPSGNGEGLDSLARLNVITNGQGRATFDATVQPTIVPGIHLTATATDIGPAQNTSEFSPCVAVPLADLSMGLLGGIVPQRPGEDTTLNFLVKNHGPNSAAKVTATVTIPPGVVFASAATTQGTCTEADAVVTCPVGTLAPDASATITVVATPIATGELTFSASVGTNAIHDPIPGDNSIDVAEHVGGDACTVVGTQGDDPSLNGTAGDDVICGLGGADIVQADTGADTLVGGSGDDQLFGDGGPDTLFGGPGSDTLKGEGGPDTLNAVDQVSGNDSLNGGPGTNSCRADPGDVEVSCG